jgi:hypothetical protein
MVMDNSTIYMTCISATKQVVCKGIAAVRETNIDIYIRDGAELISSGLVMKMQVNGNQGLTTPVGIVTSWDTSGDDAKGTLSLNTTECIAAFANVQNVEMVNFNVLIYTTTDPKLECNGLVGIVNFPSSTTVDPTTLDQADTIAELTAGLLLKVDHSDFSAVPTLSEFASSREVIVAFNDLVIILKG